MAEAHQVETSEGVEIRVVEEERAPESRLGPREWIHEKLFSTWYDALLTVVFGAGLLVVLFRGFRFVFVNAEWTIIRVNLTTLSVGLFPRSELWRPWTALFALVAFLAVALGLAVRSLAEAAALRGQRELTPRARIVEGLRRTWPMLTLLTVFLGLSGAAVPIVLVLLLIAVAVGGFLAGRRAPVSVASRWLWVLGAGVVAFFSILIGFGGVSWNSWGGLLLTLFLAVAAIGLSFPLGVAAALGRRSSLPAIRMVSVAYIELIRGVPLITLLFMGAFMLGFVFPRGLAPGDVIRAVIALTLFTGAYVAEIVRGGLQGVPRGQVEAAQAVGLSPYKVTRLVVLPQALRSVIPALVGQFISLFKDTSLVAIIALQDFLFFARSITNQPQFLGQRRFAETLTFAAFVYWAFAYTMSKESQRLERRLGVGER